MPGAIMQLVSYGAEDLYLTGNPQVTQFKMVYRRTTNYAMEYIENFFFTQPNFTTQEKTLAKAKVERYGDLYYDTYLIYDLPDVVSTVEENFQWVRNIGHRIISYVELTVDGQKIDRQYGRWMDIWGELTTTESKKEAYNRLIGQYFKLRPRHGSYYPDKGSNVTIPATELMIPLHFWYCKNPGLALPLIALQYTEIWIYVEFNELNELFTLGENNLSPCAFFSNNNNDPLRITLQDQGFNATNIFWKFVNQSNWSQFSQILGNYIYLDTDERRKFAAQSHEYLIDQVQFTEFRGLKGGSNMMEFYFFHPTKELIWAIQRDNVQILNDWNNYTFVEQVHDYKSLKDEYILKYDFLNQMADTNFLNQTNGFITNIERQPLTTCNPDFLGSGLSRNITFNDYTNIMLSSQLIFNGNARFEEMSHVFFNYQQPYKYHTHCAPDGVYVYSFAMNPEELQPSGTCNFSRVQKSELLVRLRRDICDEGEDVLLPNSYNLFLYGLNYNVFRIIGGIGQVAFQG